MSPFVIFTGALACFGTFVFGVAIRGFFIATDADDSGNCLWLAFIGAVLSSFFLAMSLRLAGIWL